MGIGIDGDVVILMWMVMMIDCYQLWSWLMWVDVDVGRLVSLMISIFNIWILLLVIGKDVDTGTHEDISKLLSSRNIAILDNMIDDDDLALTIPNIRVKR